MIQQVPHQTRSLIYFLTLIVTLHLDLYFPHAPEVVKMVMGHPKWLSLGKTKG